MVVQHNMSAMNANRQLSITTNAQSKSTEKLSSGYRINRAADDAAGLTISEKMRNQIRGLNQASTNAQDGISLIQTAEGALSESHSILQRMSELATQGANDSNEGIDRDAINEELRQLTDELDRISKTTQFNKQNLIDGTFQDKNLLVGANANQKIGLTIGNMDSRSLGLREIKAVVNNVTYSQVTFSAQTGKVIDSIQYKGMTYQWNTAYTLSQNLTYAKNQFKAGLESYYTEANYVPQSAIVDGKYMYAALSGVTAGADKTINGIGYYSNVGKAMSANVSAAIKAMSNSELTAAKLSTYAKTVVMTAAALDSYYVVKSNTTKSTTNISRVSSYEEANATLTAVQNAINKVSKQRSALGALQNRLEHTVANLDTSAENAQSAESRVRDLDMANEMVSYSKNNILSQAGQSMLAQANQSTQGVLSLLG